MTFFICKKPRSIFQLLHIPLHCDLSFRGDVQVLGVVMTREREQQKLSPWITIAVLALR
jgi:hypothetical protein